MKHAFEVVSKAIKILGAVAPQSASAGNYTTGSANRVGFSEAIVMLVSGAVSGAPTATSVSVDIEHSDDGSTWASYATGVASLNGANQSTFAGVDLLGAKKYVRAKVNVSFTGGTSPGIQLSAVLVGAGSDKIPVA